MFNRRPWKPIMRCEVCTEKLDLTNFKYCTKSVSLASSVGQIWAMVFFERSNIWKYFGKPSCCVKTPKKRTLIWSILFTALFTQFNKPRKECCKETYHNMFRTLIKQGLTLHRLMAHPVVCRYLSYSTTFAKHAVHCLRRYPAFAGLCWDMFVLICSVRWWVSKWPSNRVATWPWLHYIRPW